MEAYNLPTIATPKKHDSLPINFYPFRDQSSGDVISSEESQRNTKALCQASIFFHHLTVAPCFRPGLLARGDSLGLSPFSTLSQISPGRISIGAGPSALPCLQTCFLSSPVL